MHRIALDADELQATADRYNAGRPAAHIRINDRIARNDAELVEHHLKQGNGLLVRMELPRAGDVFFALADYTAPLLAMDAIRMEGVQADTVLHGDGALRHDYAVRLRQIRADGMDQALGRPVPGINTLAAPVFNHAGQLALVMAVMGSSGSYDTDFAGEVGQLLAAAARRVSWRLGAIDTGAGEGAGR